MTSEATPRRLEALVSGWRQRDGGLLPTCIPPLPVLSPAGRDGCFPCARGGGYRPPTASIPSSEPAWTHRYQPVPDSHWSSPAVWPAILRQPCARPPSRRSVFGLSRRQSWAGSWLNSGCESTGTASPLPCASASNRGSSCLRSWW